MQNNRIRQILRILIAVIALITIIVTGVIIYQKIRQTNKKAIEAIPLDAAFIINIDNSSKLWKEEILPSDIWNGFANFDQFNQLKPQITWLDSLTHSDAMVSKIISDQTLNISLHCSKDRAYSVLFSIDISKELSDGAHNFLSNIINTRAYSTVAQDKITIYKSHKSDGFSFYTYQGVFACSSDLNLLKASSNQIQKEQSLLNIPEFLRAKASAGKKAKISIYVNPNQLFNNIAPLFNPNIEPAIKGIGDIKGWCNTELLLRKDLLLMSGYIVANEHSYLESIKDAPPLEADFSKELDESTFYFCALSISEFEHYSSKYIKYKQLNHKPNATNTLEQSSAKALWKKLAPIQVIISASTISDQTAWILSIKPKDIIQGQQILLDEMSSRSANQNEVDTFGFHGHTIGKIDLGKSAQLFGAVLFSKIDIRYYSIGKNYIHFSKEKAQLETMITRIEDEKSLEKCYIYRSFSSDINTNSTLLFYLSPFNGIKEINSNLDTTNTFGRLLHDLAKKTPYIGAKLGGYQNPYYSVSVCWKYLINANTIEKNSLSTEPESKVKLTKRGAKKGAKAKGVKRKSKSTVKPIITTKQRKAKR